MELFQLKLFASLAETLNFTKTAEAFFITQPAVSRQIKQLEYELGGISLLKRDSHTVSITPEGWDFLSYARRILDESEAALDHMYKVSSGQIGAIRIAGIPSSISTIMSCVKVFSGRYPSIRVRIDILEGVDLNKALLAGDYDIVYVHNSGRTLTSVYSYSHIGQSRMMYYVPISFIKDLSNPSFLPEQLVNETFITVNKSEHILTKLIGNVLTQTNLLPRQVINMNRTETILMAVNAGMGYTILPSGYIFEDSLPNIIALPANVPNSQMELYIGWKERSGYTSELFCSVVEELTILNNT